MKRFLVLQTIVLQSDKGAIEMQEPVMDFDTKDEAIGFISEQVNPAGFLYEDQFPEDEEQEHDFYAYESVNKDADFDEEYCFDEEHIFPYDGDGDAD